MLRKGQRALWPLNSGPQEIKPLDGLRAVAALSVLFYHTAGTISQHMVLFGHDITFAWYYTQTGVHLFFVLSGFLLFMPYARAMLRARPLPSARLFFRRRALRILPAYWVCLAVLVLIQLPHYASATGLANVITHIALLHDYFPNFNRAIEGPFWTLALEAQFYLLLPLMAAGIAWFVHGTRSLMRLVGGVLMLMALALIVRELDAAGQWALPHLNGTAATTIAVLVRITLGSQGKFLEVFAIGMLCSALYIAVSERKLLSFRKRHWIGIGLFISALVIGFVLAHVEIQAHIEAPNYQYMGSQPWNLKLIFGPWLIGTSYGALLLAVLWSGRIVHMLFALAPLRFIGLISYSLYLWHERIVFGTLPLVGALPLWGRVMLAFAVAYTSYQLIERPFLKRRRPKTTGELPAPTPTLHNEREPAAAGRT